MNFLVYYSNDPDETGPAIADPGAGGFGTLNGTVTHFGVQATDGAGVYRVVIAYDDVTAGQWKPLYLTDKGQTGKWEGDLALTGPINYFVQALDNHGNVSVYSETAPDRDAQGTAYGSTWSAPKMYGVSETALFSDDFEDNDISDWTHTKGSWAASGGTLSGTFNKKADIMANKFAGCSTCTVEADLRVDTPGGRVSLLAWYRGKADGVEIRLSEDLNKVLLKQQAGGVTVAKKAARFTIDAGVTYHVKVSYASGVFNVEINGAPVITGLTTSAAPDGPVGFRIQSTTGANAIGSYDNIFVY